MKHNINAEYNVVLYGYIDVPGNRAGEVHIKRTIQDALDAARPWRPGLDRGNQVTVQKSKIMMNGSTRFKVEGVICSTGLLSINIKHLFSMHRRMITAGLSPSLNIDGPLDKF